MVRRINEGIPFYEFDIFRDFSHMMRHAIFTRHSNIDDDTTIKKVLQIEQKPLSFKTQLHSNRVAVMNKDSPTNKSQEGDAFITALQKLPLLIRIADCASILIFDPIKKVIANIHAGWRGLAKSIIRTTLTTLQDRFGSRSKNLFAAISPMLGPCCSQFSYPKKELPQFLHPYIEEKNRVNLWAATEGQLRECGISESHIENPRLCTSCHLEDFYSYRRDKTDDRFGTVIMLL